VAVAVCLLAGFYVLSGALVAGLLALAAWTSRDHFRTSTVVVLALAALVAVTVIRAIVASRRDDDVSGCVPLGSAEHPALWAEIAALAGAVGTRVPDRVLADATVNAGVTDRSRALGLIGGRRTMRIGLALLVGLSVDELRAVLAHELGHYSRSHTKIIPVVYRGGEQLARTIVGLEGHRFLRRFFVEYQGIYLLVCQAMIRRQEYEADRESANLTSPAVTITALHRIAALSDEWAAYLGFISQAVHRGLRPVDLAEGFRRHLDDPRRLAELAARADVEPTGRPADPSTKPTLRQAAAETAKRLYASHPSIEERAAALQALPARSTTQDRRPALTLLGKDGTLPVDAFRELLVPEVAAFPAHTWDDIATRLMRGRQEPAVARVRAAAGHLLGRPASVEDVFDLIDAGRADRILESRDQAGQLATYLVGAAVDAGDVRLPMIWANARERDPIDAIGRPMNQTQLRDQVATALAQRDTSRLREIVGGWRLPGAVSE